MMLTQLKKFGEEDSSMQERNGSREVEHNKEDHSSMIVTKVVDHKSEEWILKMIVEYHMCPYRSWFEYFKEEKGSIIVDHMESREIMGSGQISLECCDGNIMVLQGVKYVPKVSKNYVSFLALNAGGHSVTFRGSFIKIYAGDLMCMEGALKLGIGIFYGIASDVVELEDTSIPQEVLKNHCWNEDTLEELFKDDQIQSLVFWGKTSAMKTEKSAVEICIQDFTHSSMMC